MSLFISFNFCEVSSLHERPISSPVGMDAVIYAAQISSSFFSSLATSVEGFLDLFDSSPENSGVDDDTTLGNGEKRIPSGALSAVVLWCDSELTYVFFVLFCLSLFEKNYKYQN
jgi:hypothetical protein